MRDYCTDKDKQALANWEKWMKERKEVCERIGKAINTEPPCLLMNREQKWELDREKDVIYDAQQIKEYVCRCGKTGCPLFWKTTEPRQPGSRNLLAEVYFSPLKLTHENQKLSHLIEDGFIGQPRLIIEEKGILGQKCLENSLKRWKKSPYYKQRRMDLEKEIEEVEYKPDVDDLIVIGKTVVQEEVVTDQYQLPAIIVEDYHIVHKTPDEKMAILSIGKLLLTGGDIKGINWVIEFTGTHTSEHHAKEIKFTNKGQIAISYIWKKMEGHKNLNLPLRMTKSMVTRFFFNKTEGIILPGQTIYQSFWFHSRTPGIFKEIWSLETKPTLPPIIFYLEGFVSMSSNKEKHENNEINNYLNRLVKETEVREAAEMALHRIPSYYTETLDQANKFTEKEIFMHINPLLYYHIDVIHKVKKLHEKYFNDEWNLSMSDLSKKLIERLQNQPYNVKEKVYKYYIKLLRRLQKKPVIMDMLESDWDMFKYHMTYLLLCTAIAEMEKCLNYKSWGLKPPNAPPGPEEEYEGNFVEKRKSWNGNELMEETKGSDTEEDEDKLALIEKEMIKEFGDDALGKTKTINLHLGLGVRFTKDDKSREEQEVDALEEEEEAEEEVEEEHVEDEEKSIYFLEEVEEEELYEEEVSEEEISLSTLVTEDNREKSNKLENEEEGDTDYPYEEGVEEDDEEEEEEEEEEEVDEEEEDESEWLIGEEEEINEEQEMECVEDFIEKMRLLLAKHSDKTSKVPPDAQKKTDSQKKGDAQKKKEPSSKPLSKNSGKDEQKHTKDVIPGKKDQEPTIEKLPQSKNNMYKGGDPALYLKPKKQPPPWVRKHFLLFAEIQWRQILEDTIDDIAVLIESINFHKGDTLHSNIKDSERAQYPC
ncbi:surface protein P113 isoform X2 [Halyomorpha halys]|uniref:surface protein P113 isoform X2 n=1 Tax=Halyomorpha halys TaxID=286706 RepID=UPI0006D51D1D|nr:uncharacterized protein LOC106691280 isoform X2 [Halyomorpha halys]